MLIPWIQVYSNLITHPKTSALADRLKLTSAATAPNVVAAGILVSLWSWAVQNACDGDLSPCSDRAIAEAARYRKSPKAFVEALIASGFLDEDRKLHDWEEYASLLMEQDENRRRKTRERVKRYRSKKGTPGNVTSPAVPAPHPQSASADSGSYSNVTVTPCNASTLPNPTKPTPNISIAHNTSPGTEALPDASARVDFAGKAFSKFWDSYPPKNGSKHGREAAWEAWRRLAPAEADAQRILSNLAAWKRSDQWTEDGGRFIPAAANFLSNPAYYDAAPAPGKSIPKGASGILGEAELAALRRVARESEGDSC